MILAYSNITDPIVIQLFDDKKILKDTLEIFVDGHPKSFHIDLLKNVSELIERNGLTPVNIFTIYFVSGPGRFTPVRTASLIANTFARTEGVYLYAIHLDEFEESENDFSQILKTHTSEKKTFAEPIFNAPPTIGVKNK